jgi:hypothetical protein
MTRTKQEANDKEQAAELETASSWKGLIVHHNVLPSREISSIRTNM